MDYNPKAQITRRFFARVQNQLHWAIHGETTAEVIYHRADSEKEHMGLQTWKNSPNGKIQRVDVVVAKNYLTEDELSAMARIVNAYLDLAELRAEGQIPMMMEDWAEQHALSEFEKYRVRQNKLYQSDFDRVLLEMEEEGNEKEEIVYHYCSLERFLRKY